MKRPFDRFMIDVELGSNAKIARFSPQQFRCLILGAWTLAAKAEPRGYLVVAEQPATDADVAHQARCSVAVARSTLRLMRELGMLEAAEDGRERCHDWPDYNPDPSQSNTRDAWRERKRQQRERDRDVTRDTPVTSHNSHAPEVEVEGEEEQPPPQTPRQRGARRPRRAPSLERADAWRQYYGPNGVKDEYREFKDEH
jgi:hypothetical protein